MSSTMYGMKKTGDVVLLFVAYHKQSDGEKMQFVAVKPDYVDAFKDIMTFAWN